MTTLTIRIDHELKGKAFEKAQQLGVPLTLVVTNALENFVKNPRLTIGEPELIEVTPLIQGKMGGVGDLLSQRKKN